MANAGAAGMLLMAAGCQTASPPRSYVAMLPPGASQQQVQQAMMMDMQRQQMAAYRCAMAQQTQAIRDLRDDSGLSSAFTDGYNMARACRPY